VSSQQREGRFIVKGRDALKIRNEARPIQRKCEYSLSAKDPTTMDIESSHFLPQ